MRGLMVPPALIWRGLCRSAAVAAI